MSGNRVRPSPFGATRLLQLLQPLRAIRALFVLVAALAFVSGITALPSPSLAASPRGVPLEDFEDGQVVLQSYADQDAEPDAWEVTTSEAYEGTRSLRLYGNTWKVEAIAPYAVTGETVFQVAALVESIGEMQGFGVSDGTNEMLYTFAGTQLPTGDQWLAVYQGAFPTEEWNLYLLPIGRDWFDRYGYYPSLTSLVYVNDRDTGHSGVTYFDAIADVTEDLPVAPQVEIIRGRQKIERLGDKLFRVGIQFGAQVQDPDTPPDSLVYRWDFGDGGTSAESAPYHEFLVQADHTYSVLLLVRDPDAMWGRDSTQVRVDPGTSDLPVTMSCLLYTS
ncbi:MAG: PKD domain-containing protein, partial [Candidatus Eisenbacteria bacterium]|nr:PKD domain-containing protein [Candidatus Eisenbacteria bacterium]